MVYRSAACLFCAQDDGEPLTREHLWSDWMTPSLISIAPAETKQAPLTIVHRGEGAKNKIHVVRHSRTMDEKPRCLCRTCNNETLGRMESEFFKPLVEPMMLYGMPCRLTVEDCLVIAAWAFKTLIVHNHAYNLPPFLYTSAQRKRFIETLFPPETNFRVWVGRFNVVGRFGHMTGLPLSPSANAGPQFKGLRSYALTFTVGQFLFQAHTIVAEDSRRRGDFTRLFTEPKYWLNKAVQIWPRVTHSDLAWPPSENLPNSELDDFCCRWGGKLSDALKDIPPAPDTP